MESITIDVALDFSKQPGPRYKSLGPDSGEEFREILISALERFDKITVLLDGTMGYSSSFLEEAFGGLINHGYTKESLMRKFKFVSEEEPEIIDEIFDYIICAQNKFSQSQINHYQGY